MKKKVNQNSKIGLVLGSGGARGFCHIGVLEVLKENNIPIDIITGCSMGALIGGAYAAGISIDEMRKLSERVNDFTVFDIDIFNIHRRGGFAKGKKVENMLKRYMGEKNIEECQIKFAAIATDITTQSLHVFKHGSLCQAIRSSISIPGLFHPVQFEDKLLVDGFVMKRMPIEEARELGADIIIAVDAMGPPRLPRSDSAPALIESAFMMIDWKTAQHEGKGANILITPEMGTRSALRFKKNIEAIQAGREAAEAMLPEILKVCTHIK